MSGLALVPAPGVVLMPDGELVVVPGWVVPALGIPEFGLVLVVLPGVEL
jgi:hypothetical protein